MNPLIKKEIRLLLPVWFVAMLLAIAPIWFLGSFGTIYSTRFTWGPDSCFAFGAILLGIASFGQEFSWGTFNSFLSQPAERQRLWLVKTVVLAGACASVFLAFLVSQVLYFKFSNFAHYLALYSNFEPFAPYALAVFSSGLWTTLLLRRMSEAFWLTLLVPFAIIFFLGAALESFGVSVQITNIANDAALALYSTAGFFWARRLFLRAQDMQWTGGEIAFPSRKKVSQRTTVLYRPRHWFSTLVWKELQLHQVNILIAGVMLVLDLASVIIRTFHPHFADPYVLGILEQVWVLWLLLPLLIGGTAVAEEHRIGIVESQHCLPVSRRVQLAIKFLVGLILSVVVGGLMPFVIERTRDFMPWIIIAAAAIFFISFYASTLARTTLQAIGLAIVVATVMGMFKSAGNWPYEGFGLGLLELNLGVPTLLLVLGGLTYWNFKWLHPEGKLRWRNGLTVLASFAFIFVSTNGIYFRAWEWLMPTESPHGPVRLHEAREIKFAANHNTLYAVLPDGRLWVDTLAFNMTADRRTGEVWWSTVAPHRCRIQFLGGSNWTAVAADHFQAVAIQSNGSLWSLQRRWNPAQGFWTQTGSFELTQIDSETNWSQVAGGQNGFLLLKTDGSLWVWGTNAYVQSETNASGQHNDSYIIPEKLRLDLARLPARFGLQTDWAGLYSSRRAFAEKPDGSIWQWGARLGGTNHVFTMVQNTNLDGMWRRFDFENGNWLVGVKTNDELWCLNHWQLVLGHGHRMETKMIQFGPNAKWRAAIFAGFSSIAAIRSDGTLWNWSDYWNRVNKGKRMKPLQLGDYSNWVAFPSTQVRDYGAIALAADGSLWIWDEPSGHIWLAPSRKPVYLGNIFKAHN